MPVLSTPRLRLLPLTRTMIETRLTRDAFTLPCDLPGGRVDVRFLPDWPGAPLPFFPGKLARLQPGQDTFAASFVAIALSAEGHWETVGQLGVNGVPDATGAQEIGYGFTPAARGQGYATEAVQALTAHLLTQEGVHAVTAQTAADNVASQRVLEKNGFQQIGTAWDEEDGDLLVWRFPQA